MFRSMNFACLAVLLPAFAGFSICAAQVDLDTPVANDTPVLSLDDVNIVVAQGVGFLRSLNLSGIVSVVDREGHILAVFRMTPNTSTDIRINEQATVKARTAAFFESDNNAFSTRTAQFIVQSNFPPGVRNVDAGPLFGVPFSNFPGSDVQLQVPPFIVFIKDINAPALPAAPALFKTPSGNSNQRPALQPLVITPLTDDLGGLPLYKAGKAVGAVGVEVDAFGVLADGISDAAVKNSDLGTSQARVEEQAALAAATGFLPPRSIRGDRILINGFRFPFVNSKARAPSTATVQLLAIAGAFEPFTDTDGTERNPSGVANPAMAYLSVVANSVLFATPRATPTQEFPRQGWVPRFPPRDSPLGTITAAEVRQMVQQAANKAAQTRAGIRNPIGVPARVWICVVDLAGNICGSFRTNDATPFSFDVHVQKARTAAFFSTDQVAFTTRAIGFMAQTFYPPGVDKRPPGPLSGLLSNQDGQDVGALGATPTGGAGRLTEISQLLVDTDGPSIADSTAGLSVGAALSTTVNILASRLPHIRDGRLSPLQVGITVDLTLGRPSAGAAAPTSTIPNGITIFPGGNPIYKNGILVGAVGVSGDGVDQDDIIAFAGQRGFEPPAGVRCDEALDGDIRTALQAAVAKLKLQFPNLTNGTSAVLDVISTRVTSGPILEGLQLPYVKFPRSPDRSSK